MATETPNTLLSNSTMQILDLLCEGPIAGFVAKSGIYGTDPLVSTYYDDVPVRNLDGSYNFNVSGQGYIFNYTIGGSSQTGITGFQKVESVIPLSSNTRIANPPAGAGPWKPVIASFNTNIYPDADSIKVTVRVPALFAQDDDGNTNPYTITYAVDISLNNGPWVVQIEPNGESQVTIQGKCTAPYLSTTAYTLPKTTPAGTFYSWKVRVRRISNNILSIRTQNEIFVDSIAVVSASLFAYPNTVLVGTEISSDQFSSIPTRSYEIAGLLVSVPVGYTPTSYPVTGGVVAATYPNVWLGNFQTGVWTDNPAWIFYDLLTNPTHGLGEYIQSSNVDKWTLYDIAQYCDQLIDNGASGVEPRFTCNALIQQPDNAYSVLLNLASTFRGMLYYANGAIYASQTKDKAAVYTFTNANVVEGQFSYSDTSQNVRSTVAVVKWLDPSNSYRENIEYIEDVDGILRYGYNTKEMTAFACTSKGQAYRLGAWTLQSERLLTETITFQTSLEGLYLRPGDGFGVYDNFRNNRSQGGRITTFDATRSLVTLDRPVTLDSGVVYSLSAIVPKFTLDDPSSLTGSNQIDLIRNAQIETFKVITPPVLTTSQLLVQGSYSTGLFIGSPWVLSASGGTNVFQSATFYTCLATAEIEPGKIEILGLEANTGINFAIQTGYTTIGYPTNSGNNTSILPPTNLSVYGITGLTSNNTFYSSIRLTWLNSPSSNLSYYVVSGKTFDGSYVGTNVFNTGLDATRGNTGQYLFQVAAVSDGGVYSTFITGGILFTGKNPLGTLGQLSGIQITQNADPLYFTATGFTGYLGTQPEFTWDVLTDVNGNPVADAQFISGYRLSFKSFDGLTNYVTPFTVSGNATTTYQVPLGFIYGFAGGPQRGFDFHVDTVDIYGNIAPGASLPVNNPAMKPPFSSGFVGYQGGMFYNVTPSIQYDTSGLYLWMSQNPSFTPTFDNASFSSSNLAGSVATLFSSGSIYTWFALTDTFGRSGNRIFGPVSGNTSDVFATFQFDITSQISGAFNLLTGMITNSSIISSGANSLVVTTVNGLSGQITGLPGDVNTALNVRVNNITVSASGAISTQIDAVSARVQTTGQLITATVGTLSSALATTGGALASWITNLSANTTGQSASIQIGAQAFVTGSAGGQGGVAIATWGFSLDANGKVVSMQATSASFPGSYGTIVFGGADLSSNTYSAGSAGWKIYHDGTVDFNNITGRGDFTAGPAGPNQILVNSQGLQVGNSNDHIMFASALSHHIMASYNSVPHLTTSMGTSLSTEAGFVQVLDGVSDTNVTAMMDGSNGRISGADLKLGNTIIFGGGPSRGIRYSGDASNVIAFKWDGANVKVLVDGAIQGTIPNP